MQNAPWLWWLPALPLIGAALAGSLHMRTLKKRRTNPGFDAHGPRAAGVAVLAMAGAFALALVGFFQLAGSDADYPVLESPAWNWIAVHSDLMVDVSMVLDPLSSIMTLVITGVGLLIHIYAAGYMKGDPGYAKFFAYLNL